MTGTVKCEGALAMSMEGDRGPARMEPRDFRRLWSAAAGGFLCAAALAIFPVVGTMIFVPSRSSADDAIGPAFLLLSVGFAGLGGGFRALGHDRTRFPASTVLAYGIAVAFALMGVVSIVDRYPCGYGYCSGLGPGANLVVLAWFFFLSLAHIFLGLAIALDSPLQADPRMRAGGVLLIVAGSLFANPLLSVLLAPPVGIAANVVLGFAFIRQASKLLPR